MAVRKLLAAYGDEVGSITATGHSLGEPGHAPAVQNAYAPAEPKYIMQWTLFSKPLVHSKTRRPAPWASVYSAQIVMCAVGDSVLICNILLCTTHTKIARPWRVAGGALACLCTFDLVRVHRPCIGMTTPVLASRCLHSSEQESLLLTQRTWTRQYSEQACCIVLQNACVHWASLLNTSIAGLQVQSGINIQGDRPSGALLPVTAYTFEAPRVGAPSEPAKFMKNTLVQCTAVILHYSLVALNASP